MGKIRNLQGLRFGRLLVSSEYKLLSDHSSAWLCQCDCGQKKYIRSRDILHNNVQSCGCLRKEQSVRNGKKNLGKTQTNSGAWQGVGDLSKTQFSGIQHNARIRKIDFDLSMTELWELFLKQNKKCALSGLDLHFNKHRSSTAGNASLDRIDPTKGYVSLNVQWVHKDINKMKWDYDQDYFIELCRIISRFNHDTL